MLHMTRTTATKLLLLTMALLGLLLAAAGVSQAQSRGVSVDSPTFDFGRVPANATLVTRTWIRNAGADTTHLAEVKTGCGCLTSLPQEARVAPEDSLEFSLSWQTRGIKGGDRKAAYLYFYNFSDPLRVTLTGQADLDSDTTPRPTVSPRHLHFESGEKSGGGWRRLTLKNPTGEELSLIMVSPPGPALEVEIPEKLPTEEQGSLRVRLVGETPQTLEDSFTLELRSQSGYTYRLSVPVTRGDFAHRPVFTQTDR